jgi:hypothetical protein
LDFPHRRALSPSKAPSSRSTPGHSHCHKTSRATAALGRSPTLRAFASSREIADPSFLDCGGWTPLWIFPSTCLTPTKAPSSRSTPGRPHFHKTSRVIAALGLSPTFRAFASSREIPDPWKVEGGVEGQASSACFVGATPSAHTMGGPRCRPQREGRGRDSPGAQGVKSFLYSP